jgi:hypothetical protein
MIARGFELVICDRRKRLTEAALDHQSDTLAIRSRQRAAPFAFDDVEHVRIAHTAKAPNEILFRDRVAAGSQHLGMGSIDDWLAIDQHPVAVEGRSCRSA